jgi:hypothetical protein
MTEYQYTSNRFERMSLYSTDIKLKINDIYSLSVQTNPTVAGPAFCESALIDNVTGALEYNSKLGYSDVIRHSDPEDFFDHVLGLKEKLSGSEKTSHDKN